MCLHGVPTSAYLYRKVLPDLGREKLFTHPKHLDLLTSETHEAEPYA